MGGTAVESAPGGLIDRLLLAPGKPELAAVRAGCAVSCYAQALRELGQLRADDVSVASWRFYAWQGCWQMLPDDTARPMPDIGERLAERPGPPRDPVTVEDVIVGKLLPGLRDIRSVLKPLPAGIAPVDEVLQEYRTGIAMIDTVRTALADRPDLVGHLDLLAADLTMRAGQPGAWERWEAARERMDEAGDARGQAAALLVAGDWHAASLSSPLMWNCLPAVISSNLGWEFDSDVEEQEFSIGAVAQAETRYADAEARYRALNDPVGLAAVGLRRAFLAAAGDRPQDAITWCAQAQQAFEQADRPLETAVAAVHGALAAIADDRFPEDVAAADLAVDLGRRRVGPAAVVGLGLVCARMARVWVRGGYTERATAAFVLADRIFDGLGEIRLRAQALTEIMGIAAATGDVAAAQVAAMEALAADSAPLAEPADPVDPRRVWRAMLAARMRIMFSGQRNLDGMAMATRTLREVVEPLRGRLPDLDELGRYVAEQLLSLLDDITGEIEMLLYRLRQAQDDGDDALAAELSGQARGALTTAPPHLLDYYNSAISLYEGDLATASAAFERYLTSAKSEVDDSVAGRRQLRSLHGIGLGFQVAALDPDHARAHFSALENTATPWWSGLGSGWRHLDMLALLHELEGDLLTASTVADAALADIESVRATLRRDDRKRAYSGVNEVASTYADATRIALKLAQKARAEADDRALSQWTAVAFRRAERARARALLDLVLADRELDRAGLPRDLVARWRSASAEVALAQQRLASAERRGTPLGTLPARCAAAVAVLREVEVELAEVNPRFAAFVNPQAEVSDLADVAKALPDGAVLIQYVVERDGLLAWAITADGMVAEHVARGQHGIGHLVDVVVDECSRGGGDYVEPAARLADLLLAPLRPSIEGAGTLLVVPAGPLLRLPFGVLPWQGAPLVDSIPVVVLPSASVLCGTRGVRRPRGTPLVVGDPADMAHHGEPMSALPGARVEAATVAWRLPGATLLLGEAATEERVRAALPGAPVVHLATHGVLDTEAPLASAILLASGGNLTAAELVGTRLDADLVVLSACHTGEGELVRNDELLGLGRTLLAAGARSAVVTLWAVSDRSAPLLMAEFHRLRATGVPDREAMRQASRHLRTISRDQVLAIAAELALADPVAGEELRDTVRNVDPWPVGSVPYAHPLHWAPFVLISVD